MENQYTRVHEVLLQSGKNSAGYNLMNEITLICPDDWHCHLRDQDYLERTVADLVGRFKRVIVMPNLAPPIKTTRDANDYFNRIQKKMPANTSLTPLMTLYLTDDTSPKIIEDAKKSEIISACKLYPAGATFQSSKGVRNIKHIYPALEAMQDAGLLLLIHGEVIEPNVDIFDREAVFIKQTLQPLLKDFPKLRIVLEHVSSKIGVEFVTAGPDNLAATITPHHLLLNRNDMLVNGIHPYHYCLPVIKKSSDQTALIEAATSGNPKFFLGTDSAPHTRSTKESCCGPAGIYNAPVALEVYAEVFEKHQALDKLEGFASRFGAEFYKLPINTETITLIKKPWQVPKSLAYGNETLIPLMAGQTLNWQIKHT